MKVTRNQPLLFIPVIGALLYLVFGISWISVSDAWLLFISDDVQQLSLLQTYKGWAFVTISALFVGFLLRIQQRIVDSLSHAEHQFQATFEHAAAGIAHLNVCGQFLRVNQEFCRLLKYDESTLLNRCFQDITHPDDLAHDETQLQALLHGDIDHYSLEKRYITYDGQLLWARLSVALVPQYDQQPRYLIAVVQDISAHKQAELQLQASELRFRTLLDHTPSISVQGYQPDGTTIFWNKASETMYGYTQEEALGRNLLDLIIPPAMKNTVRDVVSRMARTGIAQAPEELRLQRKDGSEIPVYSSHAVVPIPMQEPQIFCIDIDLSEHYRQERQLNFLSRYDPLTQLANRQHFNQELNRTLRQAQETQQPLTVFLLDLDNFKNINDSFGHATGDLLLQQVAQRLQLYSQETCLLARLGGDEFALMYQGLHDEQAEIDIARTIMNSFQAPFIIPDHGPILIAASIGICAAPRHMDNAEGLLQGADAALYKAKASGRNTFSLYSQDLADQVREQLLLETRLRRALDEQHLCCYFQPQVDFQSGRMQGAELLVRWIDPEQGLIPPNHFIPLAESCGLIHRIGQLVLEQACFVGQHWRQQGLPDIRLAINVSSQQFGQAQFQTLVHDTLMHSGFPPHLLELEITESALLGDEHSVIDTMQQLRNLGVRMAIDDFGTGYSSLSYLKRLPLDVLKIDKRFVDDLEFDEDDQQISQAIIQLAKIMKLSVLAEGVETAAQWSILQSLGCDSYQGYYYSKPLPKDEFVLLLQQESRQPNTPLQEGASTSH